MDPFTTLGLARRYDLDKAELERRYRDLQQALHPDKYTGASASERSMTLRKAVEVNEAYRVLRDDAKRAEALLAALSGGIRAVAVAAEREPADPQLLMEMMELRESLADARDAHAQERIAGLSEQVGSRQRAVRDALVSLFALLETENTPDGLRRARELVGRMRYYRRFLDEVAAFEDEALR
jgi:molecular chaperone HscB